MKIFDAFVFGQRERAILNVRIDTTCGLVDHTIISVGTSSHSSVALAKPHLAKADIDALRARCPRTPLHVVRADTHMPPNVKKNRSWLAVLVQMNALAIKVRHLGLQPGDAVIVTEHDEIPSPWLLASLRAQGPRGGLGAAPFTAKLRTSLFYFYHAGCYGGHEWNAGFVANGAALDVQVGANDRHSGRTLPPTSTHNSTWPEAADSDGQVVLPQRSPTAAHYPYIDLQMMRLGFTNRVSGLDRYRLALGMLMGSGGRLPKAALSQAFPADGFPAPHVLPNASWPLSTFMSPTDVLEKLRNAAHTECNVAPFNTLEYQTKAQRQCLHFCKDESRKMLRTHQRALHKQKDPKPSPVAEDAAALGARAYPPALCRPEYGAFAPSKAWCARWGGRGQAVEPDAALIEQLATLHAWTPAGAGTAPAATEGKASAAATPAGSAMAASVSTDGSRAAVPHEEEAAGDGGHLAKLRKELAASEASTNALRQRLAEAELAAAKARVSASMASMARAKQKAAATGSGSGTAGTARYNQRKSQ